MTGRMSFPPFGLSLSKPSTERSEVLRLRLSQALRLRSGRTDVVSVQAGKSR